MPLVDVRPPAVDLFFRAGNTFTLTLNWPTGSLAGRTYTSTLGAASLSVSIAGDVMTVTATAAQTAAVTAAAVWLLTNTTGGGSNKDLIGTWVPSDSPQATSSVTVNVTQGAATVAVTAFGNPDPGGQLSFATVGATIDQTTARTLENRWLQFIRDSGVSASLNYLGGDVSDSFVTAPNGTLLWIGADWFDGTTIDGDDTYNGTALPIRNGAVLENTPGTFGPQIYRTGTSGIWLSAQLDGGFPSNNIWWPIAGLNDGGTNRVTCTLIDTTAPSPFGKQLDFHIVTLNALGTYASHVATGFGSVTANFWPAGIFRDTSFTYIYAVQQIPPFDANTGQGQPNYGQGDLNASYTFTRVARVANGSLTTVSSWTFWNGTTWVSGVTNATPMVDTLGQQIQGDAGVAKLGTNRYLLVVHRLNDSHLNVFKSANPQGPWEQISRVPLPAMGHTINGGHQVGQLTKILPSAAVPSGLPAEHSLAMISRNLLTPTDAFADLNIRRFAPQFAVIPNN